MTLDKQTLALLDQLKNEFITELPGRIHEIEQLILGLESNNHYEEIYRMVHSLKGSGGTHGLQIISVICHQLETFLEKEHTSGQINSSHCIDHCLEYIDLLNQTHKAACNKSSDFSKIQLTLNKLSDAKSPYKHKALIIESSNLQIDLIRQSLSSLPISIDTNNNGLRALGILLHKKYDIIITGMEINELNGEALISAIRLSKAVNKNTKSILVTSKEPGKYKRATDPDRIIRRNTELGKHLEKNVIELLQLNTR